ncbi:integrase core domain-containing protein [Glutamicibacter sp. BW77]|uniref:integrase core domain-containing protein n=1 Tax=Glutamicibacter TaxID=1742989 RepID=UPI001144175E|nr:integrase core domain-containing protein [Glutamicibacter sp. BW77]
MPISGLRGRPTTQRKNERSHQTMQRFLEANKPQDLADLRKLITRYHEHYNRRGPHQTLNQSTPEITWQTLDHSPAIEPIHLSVLQAKAAEYLRNRILKHSALGKASIAVSKTGEIIDASLLKEPATGLAANQMLVDVAKDQQKAFYKGLHISVPQSWPAVSIAGP